MYYRKEPDMSLSKKHQSSLFTTTMRFQITKSPLRKATASPPGTNVVSSLWWSFLSFSLRWFSAMTLGGRSVLLVLEFMMVLQLLLADFGVLLVDWGRCILTLVGIEALLYFLCGFTARFKYTNITSIKVLGPSSFFPHRTPIPKDIR